MAAHFTQDTFDFLADLAQNNSRDWFEANRARYEAHYKDAALAFIEALAGDMAVLDPPLTAQAKVNGSLRRINRDVRFSKDKSPYNAHMHLVFWAGDHPNRSPGMHLSIHAGGIGYGTGLYGLSPGQLTRYRDMVSDPVEFRALTAALDSAERVGCTTGAPDLARIPKGYDVDGRAAELIRHKSIIARTHDGPQDAAPLMRDGAVDWVMGKTNALMPLIRWLMPI